MNHHAAFTQFFSELKDPRQVAKIEYPFFDVVFDCLCRHRWGHSWEDIELFGEAHLNRNGLFPNGLPVHDTIARIISRIQPEQFQNAFVRWMVATSERTDGELIAIDGKTLRTRPRLVANLPFIWSVPLPLRIVWCSVKSKRMPSPTKLPPFRNYCNTRCERCLVSIDAMGSDRYCLNHSQRRR